MSIEILGNEVVTLLGEIKGKCIWCGNCCEEELFFLTDTEAPNIAAELFSMGDYSLVQKHILFNQAPMNVIGRYPFGFKGRCPFWQKSGCKLGKGKPLVCKLFPLALIALVDNQKLNLREPLFSVTSPRKGKSCSIDTEYIVERMKKIGEISSHSLVLVQSIMAAALLDKGSLVYCFGQPLQRGAERFNPRPDGVFISESEVSQLLFAQYTGRFRHLLSAGKEPYSKLSVNQIEKLVSKNAVRRAKVKIGKRMKHLERYRPEVIQWYDLFSVMNQ